MNITFLAKNYCYLVNIFFWYLKLDISVKLIIVKLTQKPRTYDFFLLYNCFVIEISLFLLMVQPIAGQLCNRDGKAVLWLVERWAEGWNLSSHTFTMVQQKEIICPWIIICAYLQKKIRMWYPLIKKRYPIQKFHRGQ